ncbi:hypothetical protein V8C34DRAFT_268937 [Trichoderma compactum]
MLVSVRAACWFLLALRLSRGFALDEFGFLGGASLILRVSVCIVLAGVLANSIGELLTQSPAAAIASSLTFWAFGYIRHEENNGYFM